MLSGRCSAAATQLGCEMASGPGKDFFFEALLSGFGLVVGWGLVVGLVVGWGLVGIGLIDCGWIGFSRGLSGVLENRGDLNPWLL